MNFKKELIKLLLKNNLDFRIVKANDFLLEEQIKVGEEGNLKIIRIAEVSPNPIDLYLTTKLNIKLYNKNGELIKLVDNVYYTYSDLINFLKEY